MLTNSPVEERVTASLDDDPRIPDSIEIAVSADGGIVTLRGTVENFGQRYAAVEDARNVQDVDAVDNQLKVSLLGEGVRQDEEMRSAALLNLISDGKVPAELVDVEVDHGWVTLKGAVRWQFQSDAAYDDVSSLYGVCGVYGVTNEIRVTNH